jgi:pimeloyl-ACP methyl ester carboxylesterase
MRRLSIDKSIFIGNSLGGWMTLKFAVNFPNKVEKLVLLATSGVTNSKISFLFKAIFYLSRGEKGVIGMNKLVYGIDDIPDEVIEVSNLVMKNYNPRTGSLPIFNDDELKKLDMPVLFIGGEKDSLLPTNKTVKRLQKLIPDIDAIILKGRGHVIFDVLDDIMNFLK